MTEPHPQPKCHGYACKVFEECADRYDDDEFPPCASHSSAVSERNNREIITEDNWDPEIHGYCGQLRSKQKGEQK